MLLPEASLALSQIWLCIFSWEWEIFGSRCWSIEFFDKFLIPPERCGWKKKNTFSNRISKPSKNITSIYCHWTYRYKDEFEYISAKSTSNCASMDGAVTSSIHVAGLKPSLILGTPGMACNSRYILIQLVAVKNYQIHYMAKLLEESIATNFHW